MKFVERHSFADPNAAARKIIEIANGVEAMQDGRIYIERVNEPFLAAGGSGEQFRAGIERAIALGWLWRHERLAGPLLASRIDFDPGRPLGILRAAFCLHPGEKFALVEIGLKARKTGHKGIERCHRLLK
jgi:hypothetical protein